MDIIGISGKIGVGKTTIARHIISVLEGWQITSFAGTIKDEAAQKFGFDLRLAYSTEGKKTEVRLPDGSRKTVRELLQRHGAEIRGRDQSYLVRAMDQYLKLSRDKAPGIVIDDVRFPDEAALIRRWKGLLVRIEPYSGYTPPSDHVSETALDGYKGFALTLRPEHGEEHLRQAAGEIVRSAAGAN